MRTQWAVLAQIFHEARIQFRIMKNRNAALPQNFSIREMHFLIVKNKNKSLILLNINFSLL